MCVGTRLEGGNEVQRADGMVMTAKQVSGLSRNSVF
jgi:hypothetical protein